jgi:multidrug resistance efflux pump
MGSPFPRTLRALALDAGGPAPWLLALALPLLVGWAAWGVWGEVPVHAVSARARAEARGSVVPVDLFEPGRVVESHLALGRRVEPGEVLLRLDATLEEARRAELRARRAGVARRIAILGERRDRLASLAHDQARLRQASATAAEARAAGARNEAQRGEQLAAMARRLADVGAAARAAEIEASLTAQRRADDARSEAAEHARVAAEQDLEAARLGLAANEAARALAEAEAEQGLLDAELATVEALVERRTVRALVAGTLGDVAPITVGAHVSPGRPLASIVPDDELRVVAYFGAKDAVGRIAAGQPARVRLDGFPWMRFGVLDGRVDTVGQEAGRDGPGVAEVRVEVTLSTPQDARVQLRHGLPATVEVLLERASPWALLLRGLGELLAPPSRPGGPR